MTDHPPTRADVDAATAAARSEAELADQQARLASKAITRIVERRARLFGAAAVLLSVLLASFATYIAVDNQGEIAAAAALRVQQDQETGAALDSLGQANKALQARGQPTVTANPNDPADAVAASVTARVLAKLPPTPSAQQIADLIAPAALTQVTGPTAAELTNRVATYFADNADALRGLPGKDGAGPTAAQIQTAVDAAYAANPPAPGRDGRDGDPGAPGADSTAAGPKGDTGDRGEKGDTGEPGPACPPGTTLQPVTFASGQSGQGCVTPAPPDTTTPGPPPTTE